jgi:tRNA (guanine37-N1)-methyltransferase
MVKLDKARLSKHVQLKALAIRPQLCKKFMSVFKSRLLNLPRCRNVVDCPNDPALKHLLLCPSVASLDDLTDAQRAALLEEGTQIVDHTMEFGFMYWTSEQILRAALGELDEITTSFETIGHIAHMNLRDEQLPHKELIGEVHDPLSHAFDRRAM